MEKKKFSVIWYFIVTFIAEPLKSNASLPYFLTIVGMHDINLIVFLSYTLYPKAIKTSRL